VIARRRSYARAWAQAST